MKSVKTLVLAIVASGFWLAAPASAQPLGSFRWQLQPYCNIITVTVVQQGSQYQLDGTDDQCGAAVKASVVGLGFQNTDGSIGFGLTIVTAPGGTPVHVDSTIAIATLSGTWRDSAGNSGDFVFTPGAGTGGGPRPVLPGGIAPGSVTTVQIAPAAVTNAKMATNAVTGANVVDGSLTTADFLGAPRAAFADGDQNLALTSTSVVVRSVSLTIPTAGRVIVNASGYFKFDSAGQDVTRCSITTGLSLDVSRLIIANDEGSVALTSWVPFAGTRGFDVTAGPFTVNLVCNLFSGAAFVGDTSLTAIFVGQ